MTKELKLAIAKTLLITQLYSPFSIKLLGNTYGEYNVQFNNFIIEKINPFDNKNITFEEELLLYKNREEAIDELMKSVFMNVKISSEAKKNITCIRTFLKDNPHIDLKTLYNLLGKLEIKKTSSLEENCAMMTHTQFDTSGVSSNGIIVPNKATIYLNNVILGKLNDEQFLRAFFHELVHLSGWFTTYTQTGCIGSGLTEGMTSLIEYDYYGDAEYQSYFFLRTCTKLLVELVGEEQFLQSFSNRSLLSLQLQLQSIGILETDIQKLIIHLDKYSNSTVEDLGLIKEIIYFFKKYQNTQGNEISKYIYDCYLFDLEIYYDNLIHGQKTINYKNSVEKVYYNSKRKKENPTPYFQEYIFFEGLEYLPYEYTILEKDMEHEMALIQVFVDDNFINSLKEKQI